MRACGSILNVRATAALEKEVTNELLVPDPMRPSDACSAGVVSAKPEGRTPEDSARIEAALERLRGRAMTDEELEELLK